MLCDVYRRLLVTVFTALLLCLWGRDKLSDSRLCPPCLLSCQSFLDLAQSLFCLSPYHNPSTTTQLPQKREEATAKTADIISKRNANEFSQTGKTNHLQTSMRSEMDFPLLSKVVHLGQQQHVSSKSATGQQLSNLFSSAFSPGEKQEEVVITRDQSGYGISVALGLDDPAPASVVVHKQAGPKEHGDGRSISMTDNERKLFMNQFKTYSKKNNKIRTMKQYIKYIMKNKTEFMNKTVNRAETYSTM